MSMNLQEEICEQLRLLPPDEQRRILDFARALALSRPQGVAGKELLRFAGTIPIKDLNMISVAIEGGCEHVDADEW